MQRGTIKKIVADKGFGFIAGAERGKDLFFHVSAVKESDFESLYEGQNVEVLFTEPKDVTNFDPTSPSSQQSTSFRPPPASPIK